MRAGAADHAALMDAVYRRQRHIYDATRAWFLLGRDALIGGLNPAPGARILEVACGTGRNLARIGARHPQARLFGLDISAEMLRSARARLGKGVPLVQADACSFDPKALFGTAQFDRIVLSYSVSMIPDWTGAIDHALGHLAPGGALHIVDFHDQAGLPGWFGRALRAWLGRFHVSPRTDLADRATLLAHRHGCTAEHRVLLRGYAQILILRKPAL